MSPKWKYFWDFINAYEQELERSYLILAEERVSQDTLVKVHANIQSKRELIKLLRDYFEE